MTAAESEVVDVNFFYRPQGGLFVYRTAANEFITITLIRQEGKVRAKGIRVSSVDGIITGTATHGYLTIFSVGGTNQVGFFRAYDSRVSEARCNIKDPIISMAHDTDLPGRIYIKTVSGINLLHVKSAKEDLECEQIGFIPDEGNGSLVSMRNFILKFTDLEGQFNLR